MGEKLDEIFKDNKINEDNETYYHFTGPQRVDLAMHSLEGLLKGIAIDNKVTTDEAKALANWCTENQSILDRPPFTELLPMLRMALDKGEIDEEDQKDILYFCSKFNTEENYYSSITSDIQRLNGIIGGITADKVIEESELNGLSKWMEENEHLRKSWPFDEIDSLVTEVMADGKIDNEEHEKLMKFFDNFFAHAKTKGGKIIDKPKTITGVCAMSPEILFKDKLFCFTGSSQKASRIEIKKIVQGLEGSFSNNLRKDVDYLVIGSDGSSCWTFTCYGRKVEKAVNMRKKGSKLLIVHENDFWDAVEDMQ
jgi:hypothetical protein